MPNDVTVTTSGGNNSRAISEAFKTPETVNLTEKIQGTQQGHKMSHNVGTRLFSGFLVSFASGVVKRNCWMKQQSNTQKQGRLWLSKLAVLVLCMGHRA